MTELTREEKLRLPSEVKLDVSDVPLLNGVPPVDDPRAYGMTDDEAIEWNEKKKLGIVGYPSKDDITMMRRMQYAEIADPLFFGWQRGENTEQDWLDAIQKIKDDNPYPPES